jgi:hypothetical protein
MLITVRVPDDKAAFFKKVVKEMQFDVTKSTKENSFYQQKKEIEIDEIQDAVELRSALNTLDKFQSGQAKFYSEDEFFKKLKEIN